MVQEWTTSIVVQKRGLIELAVPEVEPGERVRVTVQREHNGQPSANRPTFGSLQGQATMRDDFEAPLEDFQDYM